MPQFSPGRRGFQLRACERTRCHRAYRVRYAFVLSVLSQSSLLSINRFGPRLEAILTTSLSCRIWLGSTRGV